MNDRRADAYLIEMDAIVWPEDEALWPMTTFEEKAYHFFSNVFNKTPTEASK